MYLRFFKPLLDFVLALLAFCLLLPLFFSITILLWLVNRGRPFFLQRRPGKDARIFRVIKFKTMSDRKDGSGQPLPDAERLTSVGKFVRKTSLDEIPQLLNVIKGDMSLIGPRPFIEEYLPLYSDYQRQRFQVRPGISGLAQVRGRNRILWRNKLRYDVFYVKHQSLQFDLWILMQTLKKIFNSDDVNQSDTNTADKFTGYN